MFPCSNQSCRGSIPRSDLRAKRETALCYLCRLRWQVKGIPTGGYIPSDALRVVAKETLGQINPTKEELGNAARSARGTRHRTGAWSERPVYSYNLLMVRRPAKPHPAGCTISWSADVSHPTLRRSWLQPVTTISRCTISALVDDMRVGCVVYLS